MRDIAASAIPDTRRRDVAASQRHRVAASSRKAPAFVFFSNGNKHVIPGGVWGMLMNKAKAYGEDPDRVMYRILTRKPKRIVPFIKAAMNAEDRWPFKPCMDEIQNPRKVHAWIEKWGSHDWRHAREQLGGNRAQTDTHNR